MKKVYCLLAAALTLGACSQEDLKMQNDAELKAENSSAESIIVKPAKSRLALVEGYMLNWSKGDSLQAFDEAGLYGAYTLDTDVEQGTDATFNKVYGTADFAPAYAVFPYNQANTFAEGSYVVNLPSTCTSKGKIENYVLLGIVEDGTMNLGFAPSFMGVLNLNLSSLPEGYNNIKLYASAPISHAFKVRGDSFDGYIATPVYESVDKDGNPVASSEQKTVIINNIADKTSVQVGIPAGTYGDITVTANNGSNEIQVLTYLKATIEANMVYNLTQDLGGAPFSVIPAIPETLAVTSSPTSIQNEGEYTWKVVTAKPEERKGNISVENGMIKLDYPETDNSPYNLSAVCLVKAPEQPATAYRVTFKWKGNNNAHIASFAVPTGGFLYPYAKYLSNVLELNSKGLPSQNEWWDNSLATTSDPADYEKWHTVNTYVVPGYYTKKNRTTSKHKDYVALEASQMGDFTLAFWANGKGTYYLKDFQITPVR